MDGSNWLILKDLRESIPDDFECIPGCTSCCAHVPWSEYEFSRLSEAQQAQWSNKTLFCPFCERGVGCTIHEERPITCRIYAVTEGLSCPKRIESSRVLSVEEVTSLMKTYEKVFFKGEPK